MNIISGRHRGRKLKALRGQSTRPVLGKVREALFNVLGDVTGLRVLDLFAGTGAVGIEAISRGAESLVSVEQSHGASRIIRTNLDLLGETFGAENCFGAIKGHVAPGAFTFFRASTDDTRGCIKSYAGQGEFTADPFAMDGGIAVCRIENTRGLMTHVTRNGYEHHVAMVRGNVAGVLQEAIERYLGWEFHRHE